jgi:hypothetical protein
MRLAMGFVQVLNPDHGIAPETEEERKLVIKLGSKYSIRGVHRNYYSTLCDIANGRIKHGK